MYVDKLTMMVMVAMAKTLMMLKKIIELTVH